MAFQNGDRVRVASAPVNPRYVGVEGFVTSDGVDRVCVQVDEEFYKRFNVEYVRDAAPPWQFVKRGYILELVDDSAMYTKEDWS